MSRPQVRERIQIEKEGRRMSNILVVDDQPHLHQLFCEELMDEGYTAVGIEDIESFKQCFADSKPDIVLLDLYLNGFEGWDLLHEIKDKDPHLPVIIVTAYDSYQNDPRVSEADGYVVKNFNVIEILKKKIAELLA
jgi:two-component system response regulator (stage 0 sporulation protein F)